MEHFGVEKDMSLNSMTNTMRLGALFCFSCALSFAGSWVGVLVDSKCYASMERNVNPTDTLTSVDRDMNLELRYCSPKAKTTSFAVVLQDGTSIRLDAAGNAEAARLVRKTGRMSLLVVSIAGERNRNTVKVDSISMAR